MEISAMQKRKLETDKLLKGEKVLCPRCGKSYLESSTPGAEVSYWFMCANCGYSCHWEPAVVVE